MQTRPEPGVTDEASLQIVSKLTLESFLRVLGLSSKAQSPASNTVPIKEIRTSQIGKLKVLSAAAETLPKTLALHGGPGERIPPAEQRDQLINDRLDNRLLDSLVAVTAAIFKGFQACMSCHFSFWQSMSFGSSRLLPASPIDFQTKMMII